MKRTVKRFLFSVVLMLCGLMANAQSQTQDYVVQSGETLYSISRQHGVTVQDVLNANPGLTENILAGQTIKIPAQSANPQVQSLSPCKTTHIVKKKETIYGISQQYGITEEELLAANPQIGSKLKKGAELCIPYSKQEKKENIEKQAEVFEKIETTRQESLIKHYDVIKIAVIAPFALNETRRSTDAQKITDFYKGFLMAVDTLKHQGISTEIYAYEEIGSDGSGMTSVLQKPMLKNVNLIIGPFRPANASKVAAFAADNHITMVTPMSLKSYDLGTYNNLFEVSAPQNLVMKHVYSKFLEHYSDCNIVFLGMSTMRENGEFVSGLKSALNNKGIAFKTLDIADIKTLPELLSDGKTNMIIPTSSAEKALTTLFQKFGNLGKELDPFKIRLFGYPEWQTYTQMKPKLSKYNSVFYTTFFANPQSNSVQRFNTNFTNWFRRDQVKSFPSYGILGYDIGQYFIRGLKERGSAFNAKTQVPYTGMQTNFRFSQWSDKGAAYNIGVIFVRFNSDGNFIVTR